MKSQHNQKITRTYSEAFKLQVIEQIEQGRYNANQAAQLYGCCPSSIHGWKKKYGRAHLLNKKVRIETMNEANRIKELQQEIARLKASLADAHIDHKVAESYLSIACKELGVKTEEFKKKENTNSSK